MRNVEIKARVKNISKIINIARTLSGKQEQIIKQHDTFYNCNHGRLKLRKFESGEGELIFYDRPDSEGPKLSCYDKSDIPASTTESLHLVLDSALGSKGVVKKTRLLFMVGQTRVHIDSVENLGDFMELEVMLNPGQSVEEGEKIANDLREKLGVEKEDLLSGAYTDMLAK
ncbi:uncharacterized protein LOC109598189 [Aethina tumida]|uniref:uncharacterized protein LOC109598189 n=1 Tax=Aethina tumida TaxID=116153 RepID=UPI00096B113D|nr:uncharacterized protein LOC109598189 [Aethina tumida]